MKCLRDYYFCRCPAKSKIINLLDKLMFSGVFALQPQRKVLRSFFKSDLLRPQAHRRFFCELFFAPFVSKKSGVAVYVS